MPLTAAHMYSLDTRTLIHHSVYRILRYVNYHCFRQDTISPPPPSSRSLPAQHPCQVAPRTFSSIAPGPPSIRRTQSHSFDHRTCWNPEATQPGCHGVDATFSPRPREQYQGFCAAANHPSCASFAYRNRPHLLAPPRPLGITPGAFGEAAFADEARPSTRPQIHLSPARTHLK